jgi:hypothetical protein
MLFRMNCINRANIGAGATIGTSFRIYDINISLLYCFNGTFINAAAASGAIIGYNVSHGLILLKLRLKIALQI